MGKVDKKSLGKRTGGNDGVSTFLGRTFAVGPGYAAWKALHDKGGGYKRRRKSKRRKTKRKRSRRKRTMKRKKRTGRKKTRRRR